jgi:phosphatidylserine decarboxylase
MADPDVIHFFNRYTQRVEQEQVYGAAWMRWTYCSPFGRLALEAFVKRPIFSQWYGWRMNRLVSRGKVLPFIRTYGLDVNEFADAPESFQSFNEFFYRRLKPDARPIDPDPDTVVFPADARHLGFPDASQIDGVFVKGQRFDLARLLNDAPLAARYAKQHPMRVATADRMIWETVRAFGADWMSPDDLLYELEKAEREMRENLKR